MFIKSPNSYEPESPPELILCVTVQFRTHSPAAPNTWPLFEHCKMQEACQNKKTPPDRRVNSWLDNPACLLKTSENKREFTNHQKFYFERNRSF
ncbi:MAG: hypothetical protein CVV64_12035 [Candidatus Wallbacteria bacterium HGW-Wallbacteria-1]|uniref:Uncharacterized protein n=1 Tax=Candidatus Wallbacteria bacterium HGW-Wallbacteria-1 TaxID=2013854 RepID=A0A2N1PNG2_9BACT|nr:MAG: hypothetical protein CVV64_12035 [Candidatus Wallbacteria bacterium HGW-Wallbacteria-1]